MEGDSLYKVVKEISFCYGHRLLNYEGACKNLHGHNAKVEIHLKNERLDARDILFDFTEIKTLIKTWIDQNLDHKLILRKTDPLAQVLIERGEPIFLLEMNPTAEALAKLIFEYGVTQHLPIEEVRFWETESSWASYQR